MKKGLFPKMVATYTIIITLSFVVMASVISLWFQGYYFQQKQNQIKSITPFINSAVEEYNQSSKDLSSVTETIKYFSSYFNTDIYLLDKLGIVYAASNDKYSDLIGTQQFITDIINYRNTDSTEVKKVNTDLFDEHVTSFLYPIYSNNVFVGLIIMNTYTKDIVGPLSNVYLIIWIAALLSISISCLVIYYFSQRTIIKPLSMLNQVAGKISKGEVDKRVVLNTHDEIGELAKSFNSMADSLEQVENNRRHFISNVSHELRSPITSIKGFITGMLDGIIPKEKEKYYLGIVNDEIQRLSRLVNDILDLSAIESGEVSINLIKTDVNELIRQTVIKFEPTIKSKLLRVDVSFNEENLFVITDRDKLIQVLTNLIDNAVKYVNENGKVKISTKIKGTKVLVQISNNGPGIASEDINHIWDRFYKSDKSRTVKNSTGLGLPIVRNILTQFGEDIWVESKDDGVSFFFTLKKA